MITVGELKKFLADKPDDMDFDFLVTAIKWVVKSPEETVVTDNAISEETTVIDVPEEKTVEDEIDE